MKRKYLVLIISSLMLVSNLNVFANNNENKTVVNEIETTKYNFEFINDITVEGREALSFDKALEMAYKNSTALKKNAKDQELNEEEREKIGTSAIYSTSEDSLSNIIALLDANLTYKSTLLSDKMQRIEIENALKSSFISIINAERENQISQMNLEIQQEELQTAAAKMRLGMITEQEYLEKKNSYEKNKADLEANIKSVDDAYATLNTTIGGDPDKKYILYIEPEMTEFTVTSTIENYANYMIAQDLQVESKNISLESAQNQLDAYLINQNGTYKSLKYALQNQSLSLADYKKELYNKIISKYNDVKSLEESYKVALNDYEIEKKNFDILEKKNELGMITDLELKQAKASLAEKESELLKTQFDHMLLVDTLENTSLL